MSRPRRTASEKMTRKKNSNETGAEPASSLASSPGWMRVGIKRPISCPVSTWLKRQVSRQPLPIRSRSDGERPAAGKSMSAKSHCRRRVKLRRLATPATWGW
jgi:hypothetical protein